MPNLAKKGSTRERVSRGDMILSEYMDWSVRMPDQPSTWPERATCADETATAKSTLFTNVPPALRRLLAVARSPVGLSCVTVPALRSASQRPASPGIPMMTAFAM
ncbi:hypothetical protein RHECNPAF_430055 [Rhizobium etli CNPAF512]|nr:hypothetical protein RHECNPAF_430055 [Rhizobium etli CNPAF512]